MNPLILGLGKQILAKALLKEVTKVAMKVTKESEDTVTGELVDEIELAISKPKVSAWAAVVVSLVYFASSLGYISPEIAVLVDSILSNPETVEAIESVVE